MPSPQFRIPEEEIKERAKKIKLLIVDIDGVMTDGSIIYGNYGDELKIFNVLDGFGMVLLKRAGIKTVIATGKKSRIVKMRAKELKVNALFQNCTDKLMVFEKILKRFKISAEEACFIGDDLIDISVLKRAGLSVCVPNACEDVKNFCHLITAKTGGKGAVREICELLIKSQNKWDALTGKYHK